MTLPFLRCWLKLQSIAPVHCLLNNTLEQIRACLPSRMFSVPQKPDPLCKNTTQQIKNIGPATWVHNATYTMSWHIHYRCGNPRVFAQLSNHHKCKVLKCVVTRVTFVKKLKGERLFNCVYYLALLSRLLGPSCHARQPTGKSVEVFQQF